MTTINTPQFRLYQRFVLVVVFDCEGSSPGLQEATRVVKPSATITRESESGLRKNQGVKIVTLHEFSVENGAVHSVISSLANHTVKN